MMIRRRLFASAAAVVLTLVLSISLPLWAKEITVFHRLDAAPLAQIENALKAYEQQTGTKVTLVGSPGGWVAYYDKVRTMIVSGTAPDLIVNSQPSMVLSGWMEPMTQYWNRWDLKDDFNPHLVSPHNGEVYGPPLSTFMRVMYYQKDLFADAGLPTTPPNSWDAILEAAKKITRVDEGKVTQRGFDGRYSQHSQMLECWLAQIGEKLISDDQKTVLLNNEAGREAAGYLAELWQVSHPFGKAYAPGPAQTAFLDKKVGMTWTGVSFVNDLNDMIKDQVDYFAPSHAANSPQVSMGTWYHMGVPKGGNVDAAWEFIDWYYHSDYYYNLCVELKMTTMRSIAQRMFREGVVSEQLAHVSNVSHPFPRASDQIYTPLHQVLDKAFSKQISLDSAIETGQETAQTALDAFWAGNQ